MWCFLCCDSTNPSDCLKMLLLTTSYWYQTPNPCLVPQNNNSLLQWYTASLWMTQLYQSVSKCIKVYQSVSKCKCCELTQRSKLPSLTITINNGPMLIWANSFYSSIARCWLRHERRKLASFMANQRPLVCHRLRAINLIDITRLGYWIA